MANENGSFGSFGATAGDSDIRIGSEGAGPAAGDAEESRDTRAKPAGSKRRPSTGAHPVPPVPVKPANAVEQINDQARAKGIASPDDPDSSTAAPFFWDLVTRSVNADGSERFLPELSLYRVPGGWECAFRDIETSQQTSFAFEGLLDFARAAEKHLTSGRAIWKKFKNRKNPKGLDRHKPKNA